MSGHQSTADMVNNELDQLQDMMNPSIDMLMADMNPTTVQARVRIVRQKCLCNKYRDLTLVQADVTFPSEQNNPEKSTPNSGSILSSMAGILVCVSFL